MEYPPLRLEQICRNVPRLIDELTSNLPHKVVAVVEMLTKNTEGVEEIDSEVPKEVLCEAKSPSGDKKQLPDGPNHSASACGYAPLFNKLTDIIRGSTGHRTPSDSDLIYLDKESLQNCTVLPRYMSDFVLAQRRCATSKELEWRSVYCVGVISEGPGISDFHRASDRLAEHAKRCLKDCHDRRFLLGLCVSDTKVQMHVFDRTGVLASDIFDMFKNPMEYNRAIICLPLLDLVDLGKDSTCGEADDGTGYICAGGKKYSIVERVHISRPLFGPGTYCLKVKDDDGNIYALVDRWVLRKDAMREINMLDMIKDVKNVPKLTHYEFVSIKVPDGSLTPDSTAHLRRQFESAQFQLDVFGARDHFRSIVTPCGEPLHCFKSLSELISAFIDVLEVIDELDQQGVVHGDISFANIILVPNEGSPYRTGNLIDFETAVKRGSDYFTGTKVFTEHFIATTRVDLDGDFRPLHVLHEAESLIYVLFYTTFTLVGPNEPDMDRRDLNDTLFGRDLPPDRRLCADEIGQYCVRRQIIMRDAQAFGHKVLQRMHPYFHPLRKCFSDLREFICRAALKTDPDDWEWKRKSEVWGKKEEKATRAKLKEMKGILRATLLELEESERLAKLPYSLRLRPRLSKRPAPEEDRPSQAGPRKRRRCASGKQSVAKEA